jgi:hypothetical protein
MHVVLIMAGSIGLMIGSMVAGVLACWLLWSAFKVARHPAWGPPLILIPVILALAGRLPTSPFLVMTLIFASLAIVPFCLEGIAWRKRECLGDSEHLARLASFAPIGRPPDPKMPTRRYPAIIGCIGEGRTADPAELKKVAARILKEGLGARQSRSSIAVKRAALRVAKVALEGRVSSGKN